MNDIEKNDDPRFIYVVEIPTKQHVREDVKQAKLKEISNLENYNVFEKVSDTGQERISARWVITEKEKHDGQKVKVKARLVTKGFQEKDKVQSDSPTAQNDSLRIFLAMSALMKVDRIRSIDITAAFLQADNLRRDIFIEPPKDIREDGIIWKLHKPLYGLNDAGRRFWIRVKKILSDNQYMTVQGGEAFYYKKDHGELSGMVLIHIDDFMMAGKDKFVEETTRILDEALTISKIEDDSFRFCGVDLKLIDGSIEVSMEDYTESLEEVLLHPGKRKKEELNDKEMTAFRKITGKISWLSSICRPDLSFNSLKMSMKGKEATVADLKYANLSVRKAKNKTSKIVYKPVKSKENLVIYGMGDALYKAGEKAIAGQFIFLGNEDVDFAMPVFMKTKLIKRVCKSLKDAETISMGILADISRHTANQIKQLFSVPGENKVKKDEVIPVKLFSDSLGTLESIASTHQVEQRMMRADVADLKQKLEVGEISKYCWVQDEQMLADILTKDKKEKH